MKTSDKTIAVIGATGYVGGRLVYYLLKSGYRCKAISRSVAKLKSRPWSNHPRVDLVEADAANPSSIDNALKGVHAAYYLVHSMNPGVKNYQEADRLAAKNFCKAAKINSLRQIVYLGGLGDDKDVLSDHLKSRREVEHILQGGEVPVTVLRAAMIIGSGSASFEILRYLVDRLPVMITPRWVKTPSQPIAIRNVLTYLMGCLEHKEAIGNTFEIGGSEVITYDRLMRIYAEEAALPKRWVIPVPVLTPRLSSYWIHLVTPVPASIAKPLAEGLKNPVICKDERILKVIPQDLLSPREAIKRALRQTGEGDIKTSWTDAGILPPVEWAAHGDPRWAGGTIYRDVRRIAIPSNANRVWETIEGIGGKNGWYHANFLWSLRGFLDRNVGGVGLRRGRRDQQKLSVGDSLDFWRVVRIEPSKSLLLAAEMRLPGSATLEFIIEGDGNEPKTLIQKATFEPKGLLGIIYWFVVLPFHAYVFGGMIKKIIARPENKKN